MAENFHGDGIFFGLMASWTRSELVRYLMKPFTLANGDAFCRDAFQSYIDMFTKFGVDIKTFMLQIDDSRSLYRGYVTS